MSSGSKKSPEILIIALSGIGDALMFTPALKLLKKSLPDAKIDALIMFKGVKDFYEQMPEINKVHYFDFLNQSKFSAFKFVLGLRGNYDYSVSVYPSNRVEYNGINFLLGAKNRLAIKYLRKDFWNLGFLNGPRILEDDKLHNVEENIRMVEQITGEKYSEYPPLEFPLSDDAQNIAHKFVDDIYGEEKLVIGFHAGCQTLKNHINRRWAPESFAELGRRLIRDFDATVLLFGGPDEDDLKDYIATMINSENCIDVQTKSLTETAAIIKQCDLMVTNDSGLMHVSAAMQRKVIALIGPTNTNYIYPWKTEYEIASINLECSPCFYYSPKPLTCKRKDVMYKCIRELEVKQVFDIVKKVIVN